MGQTICPAARRPENRIRHDRIPPIDAGPRSGILTHLRNVYTMTMGLVWGERKRRRNLTSHGLDFVDAAAVFQGPTFTFQDDRYSYEEPRFVTLGLLNGIPVSIAHTEAADRIRIISFRKATKREQRIFFEGI